MNRFAVLALGAASLLSPRPGLARENHGAHEHGRARVDVAIEGNTVTILFESPAMSIYGFEHEAKTAPQVRTRDEALARLRNDIGKFIIFDAGVGCKVEVKSLEPFVTEDHDANHKEHTKSAKKKSKEPSHKEHGEHGEVHGTFVATCQKDPTGTMLRLGFWEAFPQLQTITVQVVGEKSQGGGVVKKSKDSVKL